MTSALIVLILTSISCSLLGVFLILRKLSMLTDAISHTVLLGIVIAFFIVKNLDSPVLIIGASLMGVITVFLIESIGKKGISKYDDAIGMIFPILFSIAVILISKFFRNVHLDTEIVLLGEVLFSSLVKTNVFGYEISRSILNGVILLFSIIVFIVINYQKLKISTFDSEFAYLIGIPTGVIFYSLMALTSVSAVVSFNSVGAILVISFFIAPSATALLFSKSLISTFIYSVAFSVMNSIIGFLLAIKFNVSIAGLVATVNMISYLVILLITKYNEDKVLIRGTGKNYGKELKSSERRVFNRDF